MTSKAVKKIVTCFGIFCGLHAAPAVLQAASPFIVEVSKPRDNSQGIYWRYRDEILHIALQAGRNKEESVALKEVRHKNTARSVMYAQSAQQNNFIFSDSYRKNYAKKLHYIPIPLELGIVGYRVCFVPQSKKSDIANIARTGDVRKLRTGLKPKWHDYTVLKHNGFRIKPITDFYDPKENTVAGGFAINMVARERIDLYCRGINEIKQEWMASKRTANLAIDESFALHYPLPRFFWTNKKNTALIARIQEGLLAALESGEYYNIWQKYFLDSVKFTNMQQRKLIQLVNPDLIKVKDNYSQYFVDPYNLPKPNAAKPSTLGTP